MPKKTPEKTLVQDRIIDRLKTHMLTGDVIDYIRTPSFMAGGFRVGQTGRLDLMIIVNQRNGNIAVLYLECKAPGLARRKDRQTKKVVDNYSIEQQKFVTSRDGKPKTMCAIIDDPKNLWGILRQCQQI